MSGSLLRWVAQVAWLVPVLFFGLALHQGKVVYDLDATHAEGVSTTADVLEMQKGNRSDITYDYVSLRVDVPDGGTLTREKLSLPHGIIPPLLERDTLKVRLKEAASIPIVITEPIGSTPVVETQMRIAGMNAIMSLAAALLFGIGVWFWNRTLRREGDPADRGVREPDPDHPAREVVRS